MANFPRFPIYHINESLTECGAYDRTKVCNNEHIKEKLEELAFPLFFRSNIGIDAFPLEPHPLLAESAGVGLPLRGRL